MLLVDGKAYKLLYRHTFQLNNIGVIDLINWGVTIIPIWFIGMTLYQRIYALPDVRSAKKALVHCRNFEYPVMAFLGVTLGLFSKIAAEQGLLAGVIGPDHSQLDAEMGLPVFLHHLTCWWNGTTAVCLFFSDTSTADSCLVAASGNMIHDLLPDRKPFNSLGFGQLLTGLTGMIAIVLALQMTSVLDLMLYSYAFMVGGLFIPVIGLLVFSKPNPKAALWGYDNRRSGYYRRCRFRCADSMATRPGHSRHTGLIHAVPFHSKIRKTGVWHILS